jgi:hypothetical protein
MGQFLAKTHLQDYREVLKYFKYLFSKDKYNANYKQNMGIPSYNSKIINEKIKLFNIAYNMRLS